MYVGKPKQVPVGRVATPMPKKKPPMAPPAGAKMGKMLPKKGR